MKQAKLNNTTFSYPASWEEITFTQWLGLTEGMEDIQLISLFTGIQVETWKSSNDIKLFTQVRADLSFIYTTFPKFDQKKSSIHFKGQEYKFKDIGDESVAQYNDMKPIMDEILIEDEKRKQGTSDNKEVFLFQMERFCKMVAIYLQPIIYPGKDSPYDYEQSMNLVHQIKDCRLSEIIYLGNFFLTRYSELSLGIMKGALSQKQIQMN